MPEGRIGKKELDSGMDCGSFWYEVWAPGSATDSNEETLIDISIHDVVFVFLSF